LFLLNLFVINLEKSEHNIWFEHPLTPNDTNS
jgi:hypothetical protein